MDLFLIKSFIESLNQGKKDTAVICLILFGIYRFYKLAKFTFFEFKSRDEKIAALEQRLTKLEEEEKNGVITED